MDKIKIFASLFMFAFIMGILSYYIIVIDTKGNKNVEICLTFTEYETIISINDLIGEPIEQIQLQDKTLNIYRSPHLDPQPISVYYSDSTILEINCHEGHRFIP